MNLQAVSRPPLCSVGIPPPQAMYRFTAVARQAMRMQPALRGGVRTLSQSTQPYPGPVQQP